VLGIDQSAISKTETELSDFQSDSGIGKDDSKKGRDQLGTEQSETTAGDLAEAEQQGFGGYGGRNIEFLFSAPNPAAKNSENGRDKLSVDHSDDASLRNEHNEDEEEENDEIDLSAGDDFFVKAADRRPEAAAAAPGYWEEMAALAAAILRPVRQAPGGPPPPPPSTWRTTEDDLDRLLDDDDDSIFDDVSGFTQCPPGTMYCLERATCAPSCGVLVGGRRDDDDDRNKNDDGDGDGGIVTCPLGQIYCVSVQRCDDDCRKYSDEIGSQDEGREERRGKADRVEDGGDHQGEDDDDHDHDDDGHDHDDEGHEDDYDDWESRRLCPSGQVYCSQVILFND
jgi:hypothetical protein